MTAPLDYVRPELFDEVVDRHHRSYVSAVLGGPLGAIRCRTTRTLLPIRPRWIPKLRAAGLLPVARLVEGDKLRAEVPRAERLTRFNYDAPLIAAFMDPWRPETHTFHLPIGEMTLSLEDAAMLGRLPCARQAMGPIDIPAMWRADFLARFANVPQNDRAPASYVPFVNTHGPTWTWIQQFSADYMADDADDQTPDRLLEVYLL